MAQDRIKLGITQGDINSISYEVIIKSLTDSRIMDECIPVVYGSPKVAAYHRKALNIDNFSFNSIKYPEEANPKRANIINCLDDSVRVELGKSTTIAGESSYIALEMATTDLKDKKIDALVTGPINKHNIQSDKFSFAGHTEYLEAKFPTDGALMLMVSQVMKIGVVTGHVPFTKVHEYLTKDVILNKLRIMNKSLMLDFMIRKPRIAVLGLNPHASDNGLIGNEEAEIILPAIDAARENNILAFGPFPADGFFGAGTFTKYDAVLAMYHDQGLIPFKALMAGGGVNYTAGLSIVRTSPAHGTSYDLAGKNEASPDSFREAIYLACDIFRNRKLNKELTANPLKSYNLTEL
ncbi:MAG: 4-hydroxythreonine-4-phosphate dehydrogenase PdxA [Bacteroidales bacterium]|nr:4-hydroxythreonine-4-phosphate dehydrogenase PdxA [Bacteroidales bacterium]